MRVHFQYVLPPHPTPPHPARSAIVISKLVYLFFRPHRFVFNFGFGFDDVRLEGEAREKESEPDCNTKRNSQRSFVRARRFTHLPVRERRPTSSCPLSAGSLPRSSSSSSLSS